MPYGLPEGAKALSESLNASREAARGLSTSIENIQRDGVDDSCCKCCAVFDGNPAVFP